MVFASPSSDYPYFDKGINQWLFNNNLTDTGTGVPLHLVGNATFDNAVSNIRIYGDYCASFNGSTCFYNDTFLDNWRTDYGASGWSLSIWYYVTSSQTWKYVLSKINDGNNFLIIQPNRAHIKVSGTQKYKDLSPSYLQNAWNHLIVSQNSSGYFWVYFNGVLQYENGDLTDVPNDGNTGDFFLGMRDNGANAFTGKIDDIRFYDFPINSSYAQMLWTAPTPPTTGNWVIDADTELENENITITGGSINIGLSSPVREVNFSAYNSDFWFNSSVNNEGIKGWSTRLNFFNLTDVNVYNATNKWIRIDLPYYLECHLTNVYMQHCGGNAGNLEGIRLVLGAGLNLPTRINGLTLYDVNGTGLQFYTPDLIDIEVDEVNITRYSGTGLGLGNSLGSAPKGGSFNDIYIYTNLASSHAITDFSSNVTWTNLHLVGHHNLAPHKLFQWRGYNTTIRDSTFLDADNGIWLSSSSGYELFVYNVFIGNCADGIDSGTGTLYLFDSTINGTRDRAFSMEGTQIMYVKDCIISNTLITDHDIYYHKGNITFINTAFLSVSSPVGDFNRNIWQIWNFTDTNLYVNCTTNDDENNLYVAIQSASFEIVSGSPELTYLVYAPTGYDSETLIYCGNLGLPSSIYVNKTVYSNWSYNSLTNVTTLNLTHSSYENIQVFWVTKGYGLSIIALVFGLFAFIGALTLVAKKR